MCDGKDANFCVLRSSRRTAPVRQSGTRRRKEPEGVPAAWKAFYVLEGGVMKVKSSKEEHLSSFRGRSSAARWSDRRGLWYRDERASPVTCQAEDRTMGSGRVWARPAQWPL